MTSSVPAGATQLFVSTVYGLSTGDTVTISGGGNSENTQIVGFGSIMISPATTHSYPAGSTVTKVMAPSVAGNSIQAKGDPHLRNVHGQAFDLMQPGRHTLLRIPKRATADQGTLLQVDAMAHRFGSRCDDIYFRELNVTGTWAEAKRRGGMHFLAGEADSKESKWISFEKVDLKVVHGYTKSGIRYLNFYVKHLGRTGFVVGGLLGEDDHTWAATPSRNCGKRLSLEESLGSDQDVLDDVSEVPVSFAEASLV